MRTGFPFLSKILSKLVEIVGAGLASAGGAFLLGHMATPATPPPVVQIVPADADTIRMVRGEQTLVDELRKDLAGESKPAVEVVPTPTPTPTPSTASVKVEKPAKVATHPLPPRREYKAGSSRVATVATVAEAPVRLTPASQAVEQRTLSPVGEAADSRLLPAQAQATSEGSFHLFAALRRIPAWFLPNMDGVDGEAPRPPLPVGQFWQSTM